MLAILGLAGCLLWAQWDGGNGKISGEIVVETEGAAARGLRFGGWVVELRQLGSGRLPARAGVGAGGWFEIAGLAPGSYQVDVLDPSGRVVRSQVAWVQPGAATEVRVVLKGGADRAGGAISLKRLAHRPSKAAKKEFEAAAKELAKQKHSMAITRLEKAVAADPEFFEARFELGLALAREERAAEALPHLEAAAAIDPGPVELHVTIAWALLAVNRHADAERAAGEALQRDRSSEATHYLLGLARMGQRKFDAETLDHLERASGKFPRARQFAEWLREKLAKQ